MKLYNHTRILIKRFYEPICFLGALVTIVLAIDTYWGGAVSFISSNVSKYLATFRPSQGVIDTLAYSLLSALVGVSIGLIHNGLDKVCYFVFQLLKKKFLDFLDAEFDKRVVALLNSKVWNEERRIILPVGRTGASCPITGIYVSLGNPEESIVIKEGAMLPTNKSNRETLWIYEGPF